MLTTLFLFLKNFNLNNKTYLKRLLTFNNKHNIINKIIKAGSTEI